MKQLKYKFTLLLILILAFTNNTLKAQNQKDVSSIKSMCGCFEVELNFSETFSYSEDSTYLPSPEKTAGALEWAQLVSESNEKVVIQHLLLVGNPEKPMIIKHWRQDWLYQNDNLYEYNGDNIWNYKKLSAEQVKGQWTQKVYQVDDSPRYEGSASWVHVDNKNYWENTTPAPLPRREYTQRSDYNLTLRTNRHEVVKNGWVHDQDNSKILREQKQRAVQQQTWKGVFDGLKDIPFFVGFISPLSEYQIRKSTNICPSYSDSDIRITSLLFFCISTIIPKSLLFYE